MQNITYPKLTFIFYPADIEFIHDTHSVIKKIPKKITVSALKGIVGILFSVKPLNVVLEIVTDDARGVM